MIKVKDMEYIKFIILSLAAQPSVAHREESFVSLQQEEIITGRRQYVFAQTSTECGFK